MKKKCYITKYLHGKGKILEAVLSVTDDPSNGKDALRATGYVSDTYEILTKKDFFLSKDDAVNFALNKMEGKIAEVEGKLNKVPLELKKSRILILQENLKNFKNTKEWIENYSNKNE